MTANRKGGQPLGSHSPKQPIPSCHYRVPERQVENSQSGKGANKQGYGSLGYRWAVDEGDEVLRHCCALPYERSTARVSRHHQPRLEPVIQSHEFGVTAYVEICALRPAAAFALFATKFRMARAK